MRWPRSPSWVGAWFPAGGHNPLEPAQFAVPVVMGTHYANFRAIIDTLLQAEALKLATTETLVPMLENLLTDHEAANALGVRALEVFHHQSGATGASRSPPCWACCPAA